MTEDRKALAIFALAIGITILAAWLFLIFIGFRIERPRPGDRQRAGMPSRAHASGLVVLNSQHSPTRLNWSERPLAMDHLWRRIRVLLLIPIVALAMVFDGLSSLMHKAADRLAPTDEKPSDA